MSNLPVPHRIDADTAAVLLTALIETPSVNPAYDPASVGETALAIALGDLGGALGMEATLTEVQDGRCNVRLCLPSRSRRRTLLIEVHLDTVGLPRGQESPTARLDVDVMHGRGACDVKGGLAAALLALADLRAQPLEALDVVLLGAIDEEHTFRGISAFVATGERADHAVVLEPTELQVVASHNGVARIEIAVAGVAAHTSRPERGRNAISDSITVAEAIADWSTRTGRVATVSTIRGGDAINVVPSRCVLGVDVRTLPTEDPADVVAELGDVLSSLEAQGVRAAVDAILLLDGGMHTAQNDPLVLAALDASGTDTAVHVPYGTDGSKLSRVGVPTIIFGPGSIEHAHGDDEHVLISDVVHAARTIAHLARNLDEGAGT